jgi:methionyl-tRNA synthetase
MYEHLVFYCWFDAPIGYVSITKNAYEEGKISGWKAYWNDSKIYHFIGKDNIPFHTIIWPAILLSSRDSEERDTNYQLPFYVKGYEYLNWEGQKFSTSKGIGLFSDKALELYPADYWRFYLASILPESKDSNFDWKDFESHINNELIANYGNLFHRITHFIEKNYGGKLPHAHLGEKEKDMQWKLSKAITEIESHLINVNLREALKCALALSSELNRYFQEKKPWEASEEEVRRTLYVSANVLRSITVMLSPYIPETAGKALKLLGAEELSWENIGSFMLKDGHEIKAEILFDKIDINKMKGYVKKDIKESADIINIDDGMLPHKEFQKVELVTGTILYAKDHPNADKLYILEVDLGDEKRQLVAALKQAYKKEELAGIQVVVVKNLEPREVRGVKSEGMLLAAEDGTLLLPDKHVRDGAKIL